MSLKTYHQRKYLFTDWRHIRCGDLEWFSSDGEVLPKHSPPGPSSVAWADTGFLPYGIQLSIQKAERETISKKNSIGRIILDDGLYKSWYLETDPPKICYIESKDGFDWTKPRKSSLSVRGKASAEFVYFIDPNGPDGERFKCVYPVWPPESEWAGLWESYQKVHPRHREPRISETRIQCMYGAVSSDGVSWTPLPEPLMINFGDTDTTVYYDAWLQRYVMYTRKYIQDRRWIGRSESQDFRNWGPIESIIWPSLSWPATFDMYTNARCSYPGLDNYHLMFPWIYERYTQGGSVYLYSSEDGICWNELPGGPVIPAGGMGDEDGEYVSATRDLVPFGGNKVAIRCGEVSVPHKYPRWKDAQNRGGGQFWATWMDGRICGLTSEGMGGFFTTPVVPQGRQLRVNAKIHRGGNLRVGLLLHGQAIPGAHMDYSFNNRCDIKQRTIRDCDPIFGNGLSLPVTWNGETDIGTKDGEAITIQFDLRATELFGFEWV